MTRIARLLSVTGLTALLLTTASCADARGQRSGSPSATPRDVSTAAVRPSQGGTTLANVRGQLHGDRDTGCLWLTSRNAAPRQLVLYGNYRVEFDDAGVVLYRDGAVHAREGQDVSFAGGMFLDPGVPACPVPPTDGFVSYGS